MNCKLRILSAWSIGATLVRKSFSLSPRALLYLCRNFSEWSDNNWFHDCSCILENSRHSIGTLDSEMTCHICWHVENTKFYSGIPFIIDHKLSLPSQIKLQFTSNVLRRRVTSTVEFVPSAPIHFHSNHLFTDVTRTKMHEHPGIDHSCLENDESSLFR